MPRGQPRARARARVQPLARVPAVEPGDLVLFPSHLLHEVPPHDGAARVSLAFNAVPERLNASGYEVGFTR